MMYEAYINEFKHNGIAVIPDFFSEHEIDLAKKEIKNLIKNFDLTNQIQVFSTELHQILDKFFLDSINKISFFLEKKALNDRNELIVSKETAINKIGHCLHIKNKIFHQLTFSEKIKLLVKEIGFKKPIIPQSMIILKNAKIGDKVLPHKDATFLNTLPDSKLIGVWLPLFDSNLNNGCLSYVPKSHLDTKRKLFVRDLNNNSCKFIDLEQEKIYDENQFVPIEVKAGTCVLIHGLVVHQSKENLSDQPRPVYTFHILDMENRTLSPNNWFQESDCYKFPKLYEF